MNNKISLITKEILRSNYQLLQEWLLEHCEIESREDNTLIYHYSSIETCSKIIESDDLRLFDSKFCNDKNEYEEGKSYLNKFFLFKSMSFTKNDFLNFEDEYYKRYEYSQKEENTVWEKLTEEHNKYNSEWLSYISCFSYPKSRENPHLLDNDNLPMWRGYSPEGQGATLGLSRLELYNLINKIPGLLILDVLYDEFQKEFFIKSLFRTAYDICISNNPDDNTYSSYMLGKHIEHHIGKVSKKEILEAFGLAFHCIPSFFKHEGFKEEAEVRLIYIPEIHKTVDKRVIFLGDGHNARPYINLSSLIKKTSKPMLPIYEITFGPDVSDKAYHDQFVLSGGKENCEKRKIQEKNSKIPYRSNI